MYTGGWRKQLRIFSLQLLKYPHLYQLFSRYKISGESFRQLKVIMCALLFDLISFKNNSCLKHVPHPTMEFPAA